MDGRCYVLTLDSFLLISPNIGRLYHSLFGEEFEVDEYLVNLPSKVQAPPMEFDGKYLEDSNGIRIL